MINLNAGPLHPFIFFTVLLIGLNACGRPETPDGRIVENGVPLQSIERNTPWQRDTGALSNTGIYNELYTSVWLADGDFKVTATLSLERLDSTTALFMLFDNHFGFDCKADKEGPNGHFFFFSKADGKLRRFGKASDLITPGKPFLFTAERKDTIIRIAIDGVEAAWIPTRIMVPPLAGSVGFRPWFNVMKIFDFRVEGKLVEPPKLDWIYTRGERGYLCFRIPAIVRARNGDLLAFAEGRRDVCFGDHGDIDLVLRRSTDNGKTWGDIQLVYDQGENTVGNPVPIVDERTGRVLLLFCHNLGQDDPIKIQAEKSKEGRRVFVMHSDDHGVTWSAPREITDAVKKPDWTWYATGPGSGLQLRYGPHAGRLIAGCDHMEKGTRKYYSHAVYSDDDGDTWQLGGNVPEEKVNECEIAELPSGDLVINMRNFNYNSRHRQTAVSHDGGETWTGQRTDPALPEPICQGSLQYWDGRGLLFSNPSHRYTRANLVLKLSADGGRSWQDSTVVYPGPAAYSDLIPLDRKRVGCLFEAGVAYPYEGIVWGVASLKSLAP